MSPLRSGIAAFCGALLGGVLAVSYFSIGFWWMGALVGGFIGWVGYDPIAFFKGAGRAFGTTWRELTAPSPYPAYVNNLRWWSTLAALVIAPSIALWTAALLLLMIPDPLAGKAAFIVWVMIGVVGALLLTITWDASTTLRAGRALQSDNEEKLERFKTGILEEARDMQWGVKYLNVFALPFTVVWLIVFRALPFLGKLVSRALMKTYIFTISDGRIAAFVGGSMGASVGFFIHEPLVGAVFGAAIAESLAIAHKRRAAAETER